MVLHLSTQLAVLDGSADTTLGQVKLAIGVYFRQSNSQSSETGRAAAGWEQLSRIAELVFCPGVVVGWATIFPGFYSQASKLDGTRYNTQQ